MAKRKEKFYLYSKKLFSDFVDKNEITGQRKIKNKLRLNEMAKVIDDELKIFEDDESNYRTELCKADLSLKFKFNYSNNSNINVVASRKQSILLDETTIKNSHSKKLIATIKISHTDIPQTSKSISLDEEENCSTDKVYEIHVIQNKFSVSDLATFDVPDAHSTHHKAHSSSTEHHPLVANHIPSAPVSTVANSSEESKLISKKNSSSIINPFNIKILRPEGFGEISQGMVKCRSVPNIASGNIRNHNIPAIRVETRESFAQTEDRPRRTLKSRLRRALQEILLCCAGTCI